MTPALAPPSSFAAAADPTCPPAASPALPAPPDPHTNPLLLSGAITLGVTYTPALAFSIVALADRQTQFGTDWGLLPVFGPFAWDVTDTGFNNSGVEAIVLADGVGQVGGAALLTAGVIQTRSVAWIPTIHVGRTLQLGVAGRF